MGKFTSTLLLCAVLAVERSKPKNLKGGKSKTLRGLWSKSKSKSLFLVLKTIATFEM
jgi:hypothetical protein